MSGRGAIDQLIKMRHHWGKALIALAFFGVSFGGFQCCATELALQAPAGRPSGGKTSACISNESELRLALASGSDAVLCAGSRILLHQALTFTKSGQQLLTQGLPTDETRAILEIDPSATKLTTVIDTQPAQPTSVFLDSIAIRNITIEGNGQIMGLVNQTCGFADGCHGLVNLGAVTHPIVSHCEIRHSRTWSHLVLTDNAGGCSGAEITDNVIGPAVASDNMITDGISVNCDRSTIARNRIFDVTDVGVVVFSRPNVHVTDNTITAIHNHMNGGLGATDFLPGHGNFTGTVFSNNTIRAIPSQGGFVFVGVAAGNHTWFGNTYDSQTPKFNYGATITKNTLSGPGVGIGIAVSGVSGFTITDNELNGTNMIVDPAHVESSQLQAGAIATTAGALDGVIYRAMYVLRMYRHFLGNGAPDPAGYWAWTNSLVNCTHPLAIQTTHAFTIGSAEYLNTLSASQAAATLYRTILNREPDPSGLAAWAGVIAQAPSRAYGVKNLVASFFNSKEYAQVSGGACLYSRNNL